MCYSITSGHTCNRNRRFDWLEQKGVSILSFYPLIYTMLTLLQQQAWKMYIKASPQKESKPWYCARRGWAAYSISEFRSTQCVLLILIMSLYTLHLHIYVCTHAKKKPIQGPRYGVVSDLACKNVIAHCRKDYLCMTSISVDTCTAVFIHVSDLIAL